MAWGMLTCQMDLMPTPLLLPQVGFSAAFDSLGHAPLIVLVILQLYALGAGGASTPAEGGGTCSKALGFNHSQGAKDRSGQDLSFCNEHHKRTCCERNHTKTVLAWFAPFSKEGSASCATMSRLAGCALCDGDVGMEVKSIRDRILLCPSFCAQWFQACIEDFFAPVGAGALQPCSLHVQCSPLAEITQDPNVFCRNIGGPGFDVAENEDEADTCYDGVPAARSRGNAPRAPYVRPKPRGQEWWRRYLPPQFRNGVSWNSLGVSRTWQQRIKLFAPAMVLGLVGCIITWFVIRGD